MAGKSERQKPWYIAEKAFASIAEAATGFRNVLDIYAYSAEKNICTLTQLWLRYKLVLQNLLEKTVS